MVNSWDAVFVFLSPKKEYWTSTQANSRLVLVQNEPGLSKPWSFISSWIKHGQKSLPIDLTGLLWRFWKLEIARNGDRWSPLSLAAPAGGENAETQRFLPSPTSHTQGPQGWVSGKIRTRLRSSADVLVLLGAACDDRYEGMLIIISHETGNV